MPIWEVVSFGQLCGLGRVTTLWSMLAAALRPDPPAGQFPFERTNPTASAAVTLVAAALVALPTRWVVGRLERIDAMPKPDSIAGTLRPWPAPPR